jgi:hypothetical protein
MTEKEINLNEVQIKEEKIHFYTWIVQKKNL